jgi:sugar transferase (PEP-CTERM/EpsH1 system associated)
MILRPVVAHVIHSLAIGGLENGVVNLVNTSGPRFRHVIICITGDGSLRNRLTPTVETFMLRKRPGNDAAAFLRLVRILREIRPAIMHSRNWAALDAIPAARLAGVGVVVHGEHGREAADPHGRNARRNRIRRLLHPLVSQFITVARDLERWLVEDVGLPRRKVLTIRNGVDLARFGHTDRLEARRSLGFPEDGLVVGTVGRLDPVKDQAGLLQAFTGLLPAHPQAWLLVAGDGPCRENLLRRAASLGISERVRFLGERTDVPVVFGAMDLFVLPSIAEGMSNTMLEAMASGLPVVATRVGGNAELVEDGANGRLVLPQDVAALTTAMAAYLDDSHLRSLHGKASRERAVDHFGLERMSGAYTGLYSRLLIRQGWTQA